MKTNEHDEARARELAERLGYFTEDDVCALYGIKASTAEAWRKRGLGPAYILAGTRPLYSRAAIESDLQKRKRVRRGVALNLL